ncbi:MAG: DUF1080 domain-containing protein [Gemmataceae bacterium]|nr:DUF1080 domain-containing protein [Gemmataceae bacterium]
MMRSFGLLLAFSSSLCADEKPWVELFGSDKLDSFTGKQDSWAFARSLSLDTANPKKLKFEAGSGILINGAKGTAADLYTKEKYGDHEVHLEFCIAKGSNSGLKFHGHYEIQITDSHGKKELTGDDCGGIYPRAELKPKYRYLDQGIAPKTNAAKPAGEWQSLDVIFLAPRFDKDGKKMAHAKLVKATLNGEAVHTNQELQSPTGHNHIKPEMATGPLMLQGDHGPVAFRNFKVRALK